MFAMMKSTIILLVTILLIGCSYLNPVEYTYKISDRHPIVTKDSIRNNPIVGVARLNKDGALNTYYVERGIYDYINFKSKENFIYELDSHDIGSEINLDGKSNIANGNIISRKYPGMKYVLYVWEDPPRIVKNKYDKSRTITVKGKEKVVWDTVYETSVFVDTETVLYDLKNNTDLARAIKTFQNTDSYLDEYEEPSSNFLYQALDTFFGLLNLFSDPQDKYPSVNFYFIDRATEDYVYYFLEKINKK
jgi:hypothetical protein